MLVPFDKDGREVAMPHSPALGEFVEGYFRDGWHARDSRAQGYIKMLATGTVTDQDLLTVEQMRQDAFYQEWLAPSGFGWFVGVGFKVGTRWWSAAVHGHVARGPFVSGDIDKLANLRGHLSLAANRAMALGNRRVESLEAAFSAIRRGVVVLGWSGRIVWQNERAEHLLREGELAAGGRLHSTDPLLQQKLADLVSRAVSFQGKPEPVLPAPVLAPVGSGGNISIDAIPMPRDFSALAGDAVALVTLHEVSASKTVPLDDLASRFHITRRELELARHLLSGNDLSRAAEHMEVSVPTARQYVKSMFAKTGTHGQAELVALLARGMNH